MRTLAHLLHEAVARGGGTAWFAFRAVARLRGAPVVTLVLALISLDASRWVWAGCWTAVAVLVLLARLADDGTGEAYVGPRVRTSWWAWRDYGRWWPELMTATDLADPATGEVPYLVAVRRSPAGHRLAVQTLPGQSADDFARRSRSLASALGAMRCTVAATQPGAVWLDVVRVDVGWVDVNALTVGRRADGTAWRLPLDANTLVAGEPGTGTSTLARTIVDAARPLVRDRRTELWVADTTGGAGLPDVPWYARSAFGAAVACSRLLDAARAEVRARQRSVQLRGPARRHGPSPEEPVVILVIDDVTTALAGAGAEPENCRRRIVRSLSLVLAQGPAVGVVVVAVFKAVDGYVQEWRHLFKHRVAFRLADPAASDGALGPGARRLGAECDRIPPPPVGAGTAYAWLYSEAMPVLVRVDAGGPQARSA
jgi:S-DNA-T family DNA segregation ATPase FtsK/SpoIIIE